MSLSMSRVGVWPFPVGLAMACNWHASSLRGSSPHRRPLAHPLTYCRSDRRHDAAYLALWRTLAIFREMNRCRSGGSRALPPSFWVSAHRLNRTSVFRFLACLARGLPSNRGPSACLTAILGEFPARGGQNAAVVPRGRSYGAEVRGAYAQRVAGGYAACEPGAKRTVWPTRRSLFLARHLLGAHDAPGPCPSRAGAVQNLRAQMARDCSRQWSGLFACACSSSMRLDGAWLLLLSSSSPSTTPHASRAGAGDRAPDAPAERSVHGPVLFPLRGVSKRLRVRMHVLLAGRAGGYDTTPRLHGA